MRTNPSHRSFLWLFITTCLLKVCSATDLKAQDAAIDTIVYLPRVGIMIDPYERGYFGLFPGITDFRDATVSRDGRQQTVLVIRTLNEIGADSTIPLSAEQQTLLARYLERFEYHRSAMEFDPLRDDGLILPDDPREPNNLTGQRIRIIRRKAPKGLLHRADSIAESIGYPVDSRPNAIVEIDCSFLALVDTLLLVRVPAGRYEPGNRDESYHAVPLSDLASVSPGYRPWSFLQTAAIGTGITFTLWTAILYNYSVQSNTGNHYDAMAADLPSVLVGSVPQGILVGYLARAIFGGSSRDFDFTSADANSHRVDTMRSVVRACCAFPLAPPPDLLGRMRPAGSDAGWGRPDLELVTPSALSDPEVPSSKVPPGHRLTLSWTLDHILNVYRVSSRDAGVWFGGSLQVDVPAFSIPSLRTYAALRPHLGAGFTYLSGGLDLRIVFGKPYAFAGLSSIMGTAYLGGSFNLSTGFRYSARYRENDWRQWTYSVFGCGIDFTSWFIQAAWHRPLQPQLEYVRRTPHFSGPPVIETGFLKFDVIRTSVGFRF